jgi:uncharacterized membrane protein (UPF0127 family)
MNEVKITFHPAGTQPVVLTCEVAKSISEKEKGLMHRTVLPQDRGMVFPFLFSWYRLFWMKGVMIPLDIIFINKNFKVIAIFEAPSNVGIFSKKFWALGFCKYIVECNLGFCKNHNISIGTNVIYE